MSGSGNGDGIVQKYSRKGALLLQIGTKGVCDSPTNACGAPGSNSSPTLLNQPADMAVDPTNGDVYIADGYGNHRVAVFDAKGVFLRQWGSAGTGPGQFGVGGGGHPHCIVLGNDRLVYTCDRGQDRIQVFDKLGNLVKIIPVIPGTGSVIPDTGMAGIGTAGSAWDVEFSPDRRQELMFNADGGNEVVWTFNRLAALAGAALTAKPGREFSPASGVPVTMRESSHSCIRSRRIRKATFTSQRRSAAAEFKSSCHGAAKETTSMSSLQPAIRTSCCLTTIR